MITFLKKKNFFAVKILIVLIFLASTGGFLFAWTAPTDAPTSGNTPPPIDISTTEQAKGNSNPLGALLRLAGSVTMQGLSVFNNGTGLYGLKVTSLSQANNPGVTFTNSKAKICINAQHYLVLCGAPASTNPSLTVSVVGAGTGVVLSNDNPRTITCVSGSTSNCYKEYTNGTTLTLTAGETLGVFAGWGGDCASAGTNQNCNITMTGNKTVSATFNQPGACSVTTAPVSNVTATTAISGGTITSTGGGVITAGGVEYGLVGSASTQTAGGYSGSPTYTSVMSSLTPDQDYRVRAYAINSAGTCRGSWINFTTLGSGSLPAISNPTATGMMQTSATLGATVTNVGIPTITLKGICYGTTANPTYPSSGSSTCGPGSGGMTTGPFTRTVTGLTAGTTYHYRGYAINTLGTAYTQDATFTTTTGTGGGSCSVTTNAVTEITQTSAKANGTVTSGTNPYRGFVMNTSPNPTLQNNWWLGGIFVPQPNTGTGAYSSQMGIPPFAPLSPGTTYYVRAYCNITGQTTTTYGENVSFTTPGGSGPTITTLAVTGIGQTSATGHGTVTLNGSTVTEKGLVWGRLPGPRTWDNCSGGVCNKYMTSGGGGNIDSLMSKDMPYSLPTTLAPGTKYYVRAYAIVPGYGGYDPLHPTESDPNHKYGNQVEFTTTTPPLTPCAHGSYIKNTSGSYSFNTSSISGFPCTGTLDITISGSGGGGGGSAGAADNATYRHSAGAGGGGGGGYISFKMPITSSSLSFSGLVGAGGAGGAGGEDGASPSANGSGGNSGAQTTMIGPGGINITSYGGGYGGPSTWTCNQHCMSIIGIGGSGGTVGGLSSLNNSFVLSGSVTSSSGVSGSDGKFPCEYNDGGNGGNGFGGAGGRGGGTLEGGCGPGKHSAGEGGGSGAPTGGGGGGGGSLGTLWNRHDGADGGTGGSGRVIISW